MAKTIVTHMRPDLDAVGGVWAIKRFLPGWDKAAVQFVPAGERFQSSKLKVQSSKINDTIEKIGEDEVIHVDTGLGPLDHHQTGDKKTCAAKRAWEYTVHYQKGGPRHEHEVEAGDRLMSLICQIDHFEEVFWPEPTADRNDITISRILDGLKLMDRDNDARIIDVGLLCLDALFRSFQNKVLAEKDLREKGIEFKTSWGKGIGVETFNDDVVHLAQKAGYTVAVRKDPHKGYVRIKALPRDEIDLTRVYNRLKKKDPKATWFLHVSKHMLLNGTTKNPKMKPTRLSLEEIIEVLRKV